MKQVFQGELMLLRWSETSSGGATITFQLSDANDLLPFKDMTLAKGKQAGQILTAVIVDGEGVTAAKAEEVVTVPADRPKGGDLARMAGVFCNDPVFWDFLNDTYEAHGYPAIFSSDDAAESLREICDVSSRAQLDHSERAKKDFHSLIRIPFLAFKEARNERI